MIVTRELQRTIVALWNRNTSIEQIAHHIGQPKTIIAKVLMNNIKKLDKGREKCEPTYPLPPAKVQAYADRNGTP